jgi:hypothetical protein
MRDIGYFLFCLGGFICAANFYLSFLRYPMHLLKRVQKADYKWKSGIPLFGSLFVLLSIILLRDVFWILIAGIALIIIDTGGFHWFLGMMFYHQVLRKKR